MIVRLGFGKGQHQQTEPQPAQTGHFNEILVNDFNPASKQPLQLAVLLDNKAIASAKLDVSEFLGSKREEHGVNLDEGAGVVALGVEFTPKEKNDQHKKLGAKASGSTSAKGSTGPSDPHASIPRSLTATPDHSTSLWYIHPSFYYEKTKEMYSYATSFAAVGYVARYGESTLEYFLHRLAPSKVDSLESVDQSLVPALRTVDSRVDENVATLLKTIAASQDYLLKTKDGAVTKVQATMNATKTTVASTVSTVQSKVSQVTSSTVETACSLRQKTMDTANNVRKSTVQTISSVSRSTYDTLSNATHHILAHVPFINSKETA
ncbi:hypothetical protein DYB32_005004 [Aphanomyces invadans]|uniref:Uncharacterized protein n=1 Tax=Aphanomyces invadans TaxID=157072 RepID=A0A3R6VX68_9STRA|nr:hypothetical protein DYB32_005004 [Aphanomyces invadans]